MLCLISPAKTMAATSRVEAPAATSPRFPEEAKAIALNMAQYTSAELGSILKINPKLAAENYLRFQHFFSPDNEPLQALLAYTGVVFKNMNPTNFTSEDFVFSQNHLRIASFCYGLLRPLDGIKPYRMEHDIKLPELCDGTMYTYWRDRQTSTLIRDIKEAGKILIYLASMDIQPMFNWKQVEKNVRIITPDFKVWKNGTPQTIVIYAKMLRGQMCRYIIKNRITDPKELKAFSWEGFVYNESLSRGDNWVFIQEG